ncbi:MAG: hypothetical protein V1802_02950 [Candidatus Aenigmatarchaeota archaeon]
MPAKNYFCKVELTITPAREHGHALENLDRSISMLDDLRQEYQDPEYPENLKINKINDTGKQLIAARKKLQAHKKYPIIGLGLLTFSNDLESGRIKIAAPRFGVYPLGANEFQVRFCLDEYNESKPMPGIRFETPFYGAEDGFRDYAQLSHVFGDQLGNFMQYLYSQDAKVRKDYFKGLRKHEREEYKNLANSNTKLISVLDVKLPDETQEKIEEATPIFMDATKQFNEGIYLIAEIPSAGWGRNSLPYKASKKPLAVGLVGDTCYLIDNLGNSTNK